MLSWNHTDFMYPTSSTTFRSDYDQLRCYSDCLFCGLVCYGLISLVSFSGFWHWRVPWWSCLPFLGSVNNERCHLMINYYTFCVSWSRLGCFISLLISKSMYYYVCQYKGALLTMVSLTRSLDVYLLLGMRGEYGSGDILTSSSRLSFAASVVGFWVRLCNHYSRYVDYTFPETLKLFSLNKKNSTKNSNSVTSQ